ncbi:hypothetical protein KCU59_g20665, partial [Aureobasidium melanogenum]
MGKVFFVGWALWEKMTFVLACLIVLTIFAGCLKLWYTHHKLRQYEKAGPQPINREKSIIRSLSMHKGPKKQKQKQKQKEKSAKEVMVQKRRLMDDGPNIPFGIRAIESGIEVDGLYVGLQAHPTTESTRLIDRCWHDACEQWHRDLTLQWFYRIFVEGAKSGAADGSFNVHRQHGK